VSVLTGAAPAITAGAMIASWVTSLLERAAADGAPEQLKRLLDTVVDQILVESRARIQPYFVAPTVRTRTDSRRRTDTCTNHGIPSGSLWISTRGWGRVS
jgi:hypothetical protein